MAAPSEAASAIPPELRIAITERIKWEELVQVCTLNPSNPDALSVRTTRLRRTGNVLPGCAGLGSFSLRLVESVRCYGLRGPPPV